MTSSDKFIYFIVTENLSDRINAGRICCIPEGVYLSKIQYGDIHDLPVKCLRPYEEASLNVDILHQVKVQDAQFLLALEQDGERLMWVSVSGAFDRALDLSLDSSVEVEVEGQWLRGVVRYIGPIMEPTFLEPIAACFFGIELEDKCTGKDLTDGRFMNTTYFSCRKDSGLFAPFSRVRPVEHQSLWPPDTLPAPQTKGLSIGDRVTFFVADEERGRHGMVMDLETNHDKTFVHISTDRDERGQKGGEVSVPLECVIQEEMLSTDSDWTDRAVPVEEPVGPFLLGLSSMVEVTLAPGRITHGTVRWIGKLPGMEETLAGLELEEDLGVSDGTFKNDRFFKCPPKRGLFVKLASCRPDSRFQSQHVGEGEPECPVRERDTACNFKGLTNVAPIRPEQVQKVLIGPMKGIQGHCNSCYMDAVLFSLFSCSSVLDSLLFKSTEPHYAPIQDTLLRLIVNPLRRQGFVADRHVMKLRQQLQERGHCPTFTTDEKDPEEFLTLIMQHILCLEPLLQISAGNKVQGSYCYQIFLDQNHSLVLPTVQQLLEHSFHTAGLKLAEVPSCLILQMPRFGKKFKMFEKIIPSLELDITKLTEGPQECVLCGHLAYEQCADCSSEPIFNNTKFRHFCKICSSQVHKHPLRLGHRPSPLPLPDGFLAPRGPFPASLLVKLQLFAVLCIETSHYVSFVKHGPSSRDWLFFDSMADRKGESDGFNIPKVEACPEVGRYLGMPLSELITQAPRNMEGVAKRLFCDAYMYLYQSPSMALYR